MIQKPLPFTNKSIAFYVVCCYVLFSIWQRIADGAVTISPSPRAAVCQGGFLNVKCNTNETILRWELMVIGTDSPTVQRDITSTQQFQDTVILHSTVFIFSRASELGAQPLESTLEIGSVGQILNGSTVTCQESSTTLPVVPMATTTIHIVGENDAYHPSPPEVNLEEQFGADNVTVVLQWTEELDNSLVTYHVSVEPMAHAFVGNNRANLTLSYNTPYNVSVVADVCGGFNASTTRMVNYVNCGSPELASSVLALGHTNEGATVTFSCSSGLVLTGPNVSTCMGDRKWEPDPREVECEGELEPSTTDEPRTAIVVGVLVVVVAAIIIITAVIVAMIACPGPIRDYVYRWKQRNIKDVHEDDNSQENQATTTGLVYADIGPSSLKYKKATISSTIELDDSRVEYSRLNHNFKKSATNDEPVDPISIDLDTLLIQLRPQVGPKWYQFGEAAGIERKVLNKYASDCAPEECIVEMFDYWLRNSAKRPTWKEVARILKAINLQQLAFDIERVYSTGKLPIEVNKDEIPHGLIPENELPPPLPPKLMEPNDAPPVPPKKMEMITEDRIHRAPPLPPKINDHNSIKTNFITSPPMSGDISTRVPARPPKP